jgi:hypothetical protein
MINSPAFLFVNKACDEAVAEVMQQLVSANLQVLRTFDLQMSRSAFTECTCPNHGTEKCDCEFVVLLVYRDSLPPTSLIAHGHDGKTWFSLVDSPEQRAAPRSITAIRQALVPPEPLQGIEVQLHASQ